MHSFIALLDSHLSQGIKNEPCTILYALKALHPDPQTIHLATKGSECSQIPLEEFLDAKGIAFEIADEGKLEFLFRDTPDSCTLPSCARQNDGESDEGDLGKDLHIGTLHFDYKGTKFTVYKATYISGAFDSSVPTPRKQLAIILSLRFTVGWMDSLKDEIWVFQHGSWSKDKSLWKSIQNASWDNLVLESEFLDSLRRDTRTFFENSGIYRELGVPWKRGLLLLGPPGNGKTETIKLLLKESKQSTLYVKSFTTKDGPEDGVRSIFKHARMNVPCILVIEDLDSLVTPKVRSFFLNELDGLGRNEGILTIATTNHPERIDDAILNRPSRFDVKYNFDLPTESLRTEYALKWIQKIKSVECGSTANTLSIKFTRPDTELVDEITKGTEGWSFAFLKELFVSFLLRVAHDKSRSQTSSTHSGLDEILLSQMATLSTQISFKSSDDAENDDDDELDSEEIPIS